MKTVAEFKGKYSFLSNFYPAPVVYEGHQYPSVEHAYQAAKTPNISERFAIRDCPTPAMAKRRGRTVRKRADWEKVKVSVMLELLRFKFIAHANFAEKLLATGDDELVEGNWWGDTFWGVCNGEGQNQLGLLLMQVRSELAKESL